jgi:hypothetical protein
MNHLLVGTLSLLAWVVPSAALGQEGAESEIRAVVNGVFEGMRKSDSAMVRPLFHAKARMITMDLRVPDRPARVEESAAGFIASIGRPQTELLDEQLSNIAIRVDGQLASVWTDYKLYRGTTLLHCGIDHFLLVNEGAGWKIIELADTRRRC